MEAGAVDEGKKENKGERDEKSRWFWAFSSRGRMCVGSNIAIHGTYAPSSLFEPEG